MAKKNRQKAGSTATGTRRAQVAAELKRQQAAQKRQSRLIAITVGLVAAVIVIAAIVAVGLNSHGTSGKNSTAAGAKVVAAVTKVPASVFDTVGAGTTTATLKAVKAPALTAGGKPRLLFMGAEYCPYCATDRWALAAALSRFGTFTGLGQTASSSSDVFPSTPTLSFHGAKYTSSYLSFTGYEIESNKVEGSSYAPLDTMTSADSAIATKYDAPPYLSSNGAIPFLDFGGQFVTQGAPYSPQLLAGMTHAQVAADMSKPTSTVGKAIIGTANLYTAALCHLTGSKPASVCSSAGATAAAAKLGS